MAEIADLGFRIDSSPLADAKGNFDNFTSAAGAAEKASRNFAQYAMGMGPQIANSNQSAASSVDPIVSAYHDAGTAATKMAADAQKAASDVADANKDTVDAVKAVATAHEDSSSAASKAGAEAKKAGDTGAAANDNHAKAIEKTKASYEGLINIAKRVAGAVAAAFTFDTFLRNTEESEQATARLNAAFALTGASSRQTSESLSKLTEDLLSYTTLSKSGIQESETIMLGFSRVQGETFERAIKLSADLAAKMGTDIPTATRLVGRALQEPRNATLALRAAGAQLDGEQQKMLANFIATNNVAGAHALIMGKLEGVTRGFAAATRETLGGAIAAFKRDFADAFQVSANASTPLRLAIEALDKAVLSPGFKEFVNLIGQAFFIAATATVNALTMLVDLVSKFTSNIQTLLPYIMIAGAALALYFGPAIVASVVELTVAVGRLVAGFALLALANPLTWLIAIPTLIYAFRDDIQKAIGVDVVATFKTAGNFIINGMTTAVQQCMELWKSFPDFLGNIAIQAANKFIEGLNFLNSKLNSWIATARSGISWIKEKLGGDPIDPNAAAVPDLKTLDNPFAARVATSNAKLAEIAAANAGKDPMGAVFKAATEAIKPFIGAATDAKGAAGGAAEAAGRMAAAGNAAGKAHQDAFSKAVQSANEFIAKENAAAAAASLTGVAANQLTFYTQLLNEATRNNARVTEDQKNKLQELAQKMAEAKNAADSAKFMRANEEGTKNAIANEELMQRSLFMSAEAAQAAKLAQDELNRARQQGITLSAPQVVQIQQNAAQVAAMTQRTADYKQVVDLAKTTVSGFLSDMNHGLQQGLSFWDALGQAGMNALNNISNKLMEIAANKLMDAAFGMGGSSGGASGGGGFLSGISNFFSGLFGGGGASASVAGTAFLGTYAEGGDYPAGKPRLVGEKGPELDVPKSAGSVINNDMLRDLLSSNDNGAIHINQHITFGSEVTPQTMERWAVKVRQASVDGALAAVADRRSRGGTMKQVFSK